MLIATLLLAFAGASAAQTSEDKAYAFLDSAMDQFASAPALRLPSSYHRESIDAWDNSVLYDDALVIIAYARDTRSSRAASLVRARNMGDALLRAQSLDPAKDGRLRNAYGPENLWSGGVNIQTWGSATGNLAWAGIALAHLSDVTKDGKYTDGATRLGQWIINNARDTRGAGGYTGSLDSNGGKVNYKSTEHNIDLLALFNLLSTLTGQAKWATAAAHARTFVDSMWNASRWEIGTLNDGVTLNAGDYIPEDVHSWGYLATGRSKTSARRQPPGDRRRRYGRAVCAPARTRTQVQERQHGLARGHSAYGARTQVRTQDDPREYLPRQHKGRAEQRARRQRDGHTCQLEGRVGWRRRPDAHQSAYWRNGVACHGGAGYRPVHAGRAVFRGRWVVGNPYSMHMSIE